MRRGDRREELLSGGGNQSAASAANVTFPPCTEVHCPDSTLILLLAADRDGDGRLSLQDLRDLAGGAQAAAVAAMVFDALDTNRDGFVAFDNSTGALLEPAWLDEDSGAP